MEAFFGVGIIQTKIVMPKFFSFLTTAIFFYLYKKSANSNLCKNDYFDCYNCSICGIESTLYCNCEWNSNYQICQQKEGDVTPMFFYKQFSFCTDESSKAISRKYCGQNKLELKDDKTLEVLIPSEECNYGRMNLYCNYIFVPENYYEIYELEFEPKSDSINDIELILIILNDDGTTSSKTLYEKYSTKISYFSEVNLHLIFNKIIPSVPFTFKLTKKTKSDLILIITIGIIILACLLCAILVYFVSKKIS